MEYSPITRMICTACGAEPSPEQLPFRCPHAERDGADHLLGRVLDTAAATFPLTSSERNPFVRYRELMHSYQVFRAGGGTDQRYVEIVRGLDQAVAAVDSRGFVETPVLRDPSLAAQLSLGDIWIKDDTGNVSGSHKGRHQLGIAIYLAVAEELGYLAATPPVELGVASCGNAGLAAAVVARAAGRPLRVFIPPNAHPVVVSRLRELGASIETCPRRPKEQGDPCYLRFREATAAGVLPLSVQGNENGLAIEGGLTLGYELAAAFAGAGVVPDRLLVQVGGGALASACAQALQDAVALGVLPRMPRIHAVQTTGAAPLARAYQRLIDGLVEHLPAADRAVDAASTPSRDLASCEVVAQRLAAPELFTARSARLAHAAQNRAEFMWAWESEPRSLAHGILDDETYDWRAICAAMLQSGGYPITVDEAALAEANALGRGTGIDADHTGTAGLAGLLHLRTQIPLGADERAVVLFTGVRRG